MRSHRPLARPASPPSGPVSGPLSRPKRATLVALAATGALVTAAVVTLPAASAPAAGRAAATPTPIATSPSTDLDFEDATTEGWSAPGPKVRLRVREGSAYSGRFGLGINGLPATDADLDQPEAGPSVTLDDAATAGSGSYRRLTLFFKAAGIKKTTERGWKDQCRPATTIREIPVRIQVRVRSGGTDLAVTAVRARAYWEKTEIDFPAAGGPVTVDLTLLSGKLTQLSIDDISFTKTAPPSSPTPTPTSTASPQSRVEPDGAVRPLCLTRK